MTSETESLLYDCRAALLQHSDEQLAALFECWFEFLIDDESMEEVLDDLLLLLGYRMRSWGTKISYASYTCAGYLGHLFIKIGDVCQVNRKQASIYSMNMPEGSWTTRQKDGIISLSIEGKQNRVYKNTQHP